MVRFLFFLHTFILTNVIFSSIDDYNLRIILRDQNELLKNNPDLFENNSFSGDIESEKANLILNSRIVIGRVFFTPRILDDRKIDTIINNRKTIDNILQIQQINSQMKYFSGKIARLAVLLRARTV